jgi:hypothetical protein
MYVNGEKCIWPIKCMERMFLFVSLVLTYYSLTFCTLRLCSLGYYNKITVFALWIMSWHCHMFMSGDCISFYNATYVVFMSSLQSHIQLQDYCPLFITYCLAYIQYFLDVMKLVNYKLFTFLLVKHTTTFYHWHTYNLHSNGIKRTF